jgi:Zn-finger protein
LGDICGGDFVYTEDGIKNCSCCCLPHKKDSYDVIIQKVQILTRRLKEQHNQNLEKEE